MTVVSLLEVGYKRALLALVLLAIFEMPGAADISIANSQKSVEWHEADMSLFPNIFVSGAAFGFAPGSDR